MIVVDTSVVSEMMKHDAAPPVLAWAEAAAEALLFTTAITLAEINYGIERLPHGQRKLGLRSRATAAFEAFGDRLLPFDAAAAAHLPDIMIARQRLGRAIAFVDAEITAICASRAGVLATRNVKDFEGTGVELVNPWEFRADA